MISVPLAFLGAGKFKAKVWEDGATPTTLKDSERDGERRRDVARAQAAPSGGAAVTDSPLKRCRGDAQPSWSRQSDHGSDPR